MGRLFCIVCVVFFFFASSLQAQISLTAPTGVGTRAWKYTNNGSSASFYVTLPNGQNDQLFQYESPDQFFFRVGGLATSFNVWSGPSTVTQINPAEAEISFTPTWPPTGMQPFRFDMTYAISIDSPNGDAAHVDRTLVATNLTSEPQQLDVFWLAHIMIDTAGNNDYGHNDVTSLTSFNQGVEGNFSVSELDLSSMGWPNSGTVAGVSSGVSPYLLGWTASPDLTSGPQNTPPTGNFTTGQSPIVGTNVWSAEVGFQWEATLGAGQSMTIDPTTAAQQAVPEPASMAVMTGILLAAAGRRRCKS
jgi:hypothetical protein